MNIPWQAILTDVSRRDNAVPMVLEIFPEGSEDLWKLESEPRGIITLDQILVQKNYIGFGAVVVRFRVGSIRFSQAFIDHGKDEQFDAMVREFIEEQKEIEYASASAGD